MSNLKIRVFHGKWGTPETTVTIPMTAIQAAMSFIPKSAIATMKGRGLDLEQILRFAQTKNGKGMILEVEDHKKHEKVVISVE